MEEIVNILNYNVYNYEKSLDMSFLEEICNNSYYHKNGFAKIVLISLSNPQCKLRLHVWDKQQDYHEHIHNHRWHFALL